MAKAKKSLMQKWKHPKKKMTVFLFILMFLIGFLSIYQVGFNSDELTEQNILRMNIREYIEILSPNDLLDYYNQKNIVGISHSVEKDHGIAPYLLFAPFLPLGLISEEFLSIAWHFYTYILFFLGVIFVFCITKHLFKKQNLALLSTMIYFFTPRLFADGLYNNKDVVLVSFLLGVFYFGIQMIEKKDIKNTLLFAIFSSFAANIKIIGFFVFGIVGIFYILELLINKQISKKNIFIGILAILSMFTIFIIITPAIWGSGRFELYSYLEWCLTESSKFSRWDGSVLFEGNIYSYKLGESLPWYYLPKMILITTPPYFLIFFFTGIFFLSYSTWKKRGKQERLERTMWMLLLCFIIPIIIAFITKVKLYNGWRHFYFLYAPMILIASYGIYELIQREKIEKLVYIFIGFSLCFYIFHVEEFGVHSSSYYNILVNRGDISTQYELDYYGVSARELLLHLLATHPNDHFYIYGEDYGFNVLENNYLHLSKHNQEKITILNDKKTYQTYQEDKEKKVYIFYNNVYNKKKLIKNHKKIDSVVAWGNDVAALYQ